jgi:NAD(P)-dependent dehydrogenase (short-subunit alcohol dehydrogenase family)
MKWGVSLLDPSMRPLLENVAGVDPAFAGKRPSNYTSSTGFNTVKYVILMTDGENVAGRRVLPAMYNSDEYSFFWRQTLNTYPYRYWYNNIDDHPTGERPTWAGISHRPYSATDANNQLSSICAAAKEAPANITVYTIAMGSGSTQMDDCASTGKYYQTSGNEIDEIFEEIARQISALRLSL